VTSEERENDRCFQRAQRPRQVRPIPRLARPHGKERQFGGSVRQAVAEPSLTPRAACTVFGPVGARLRLTAP
jgi:hypothetical protein